jgi:branched-chain amino acid transport system substrate-binding protein
VTTASQNEQIPEAVGKLASDSGVKSIFILVPNYQGGREIAAGFRRSFTGKVVGQTFYKLGEADFRAEISAVRNAKPEAIFLFAPGGMGIAFMKQWNAAVGAGMIKIYSAFTIDHLTLPAIGDAAVGSLHIYPWNTDSDSETNQRFVKDFVAKFNQKPSDYAALAYDGARLLAAAARAVDGKVDDTLALAKAMRKTGYPSLRGGYSYNVNGFPIYSFYSREVVKGADGKPTIVTRGAVLREFKDSHWEQCPSESRH